MTFLPIAARELRVGARRRVTYWVRSGAALALLVIGTIVFELMRPDSQTERAKAIFAVLTGTAVLYAFVAGVRDTADCLSWEKREGTLGLLFLTDLKGYDVVLGKLAAHSLNAFYSVVAVLPMLAIPLLMGGITFGEVARTAMVALNTLFFSLTAGLCVSSFSRSAQRSVGGTFFLILLVSGLIPLCGGLMLLVDPAFPAVPGFMMMSSGYTYYQAWDAPYQVNPEYFWWSLGLVHGLAWFFLALASLIAPRSWQDRPAGVRKLRWRERWKDWTQRDPVQRTAFRRRLLGINPFFWLAARNRLKPFYVWFTLALLASAWFWGLYKMRREWLNFGILGFTAVILNILVKTWFAAESGRQLAEERKQGALELLLSTPLEVRDIMRGQSLALQRQFLGPLAAVLFIAFLFMWEGARQDVVDSEFQHAYFLFWIGGMILLPADLAALYYVGMWQAMTARNPNRAASVAVAQILVLPGLAFLAIWLLAALASARGGEPPGPGFSLALWFGLGIATDLLFGGLARHRLLTEFRQAAEQPYAARPGFWKRFFSG